MLQFLAILFIFVFIYFYVCQVKKFSYWRRKNVLCIEPNLVIGNLKPLFTNKKSIGEFLKDVHLSHPDEPYVGLYFGGNPCLVIRDYEVCKRILKDDKAFFTKRILHFDKESDPVLYHTLFHLTGEQWSSARKGMSPAFTSSRLKSYLNKMMTIVDDLHLYIDKNQDNVNGTQMIWNFTVDSISRALLGFSGNALLNPNDDMLRISKQVYGTDLISKAARVLLFAAPQIYNLLKLHAFPLDGANSLEKLTWELVKLREKNNLQGKDLMSQLMDMRKQVQEDPTRKAIFNWDGYGLSGQVMAVMLAGTDTSSSAITFALYELGKRPDIQEQLRAEVNETFPDDVTADFDKLMSMKYLTMVVTEVMRHKPPFPFVDRLCTSEYQIPGTKLKIDPGVFVFVPMWGLQVDPAHWENPEEFLPERFSDPDLMNHKPYLPFSYGPRTCIGMRFAVMQMRLVLASMLKKWHWKLRDDTSPLKLNPATFSNQLEDDLMLEFRPV